MTREEIRKEILKIQRCETNIECPLEYDDPCLECRTNQIIAYLHSQGVVIKVEREFPKIPYREYIGIELSNAEMGKIVKRDLDKAGCGFFEPLIKEEK